MNKQLLNFYAFLKENGVIWGPEPDIYNPVPGHYTYGPFGKSLKNSIENYLRYHFDRNNYYEIDVPLILPKIVWQNSGHWDKFQDPIILTKSGLVYRLDKLIEEQFPDVIYGTLNKEEIIEYANKLVSINKDDPFVHMTVDDEIKFRNLMMKTYSGDNECALRPETATATYMAYPNAFTYFGKQLPFGLYQIGKAFRNELNPRQNVTRCREFTQAEAHIFIDKKNKEVCNNLNRYKNMLLPIFDNGNIVNMNVQECIDKKIFSTEYYAWCIAFTFDMFKKLNIPEDCIRLRQHAENEKAFYALDAFDIELKLNSLGWMEIVGIHDRGSYDLTQHKIDSSIAKDVHILEIAIGVDRLIFSLLDILYNKKSVDIGKTIVSLPHFIAPIQISVLPLVKNKTELVNKANNVYKLLKRYFRVEYDDKQAIGKRYLKNGIKGIPYSVTIDFETIKDNSVTVRDRDTELQIRLSINELVEYFRNSNLFIENCYNL
jgi:glycyl-tRNA synthetase